MGQGTEAAVMPGGRGDRKRCVPAWLACLVLLVVLVGAGSARGQAITGRILSVGIGGTEGQGGLYRAGTWVPVQLRVENRSGKQFVGRIGIESKDLDGDKVICLGPKFILQPTDLERILWAYYWPRPDDTLVGISTVAVYDETGTRAVSTITTPEKRQGAQGIGAREQVGRSQRNVLLMGNRPMGWGSYTGSWSGSEGVRFSWIRSAAQMPDDARGLDGVDLIVWQADSLKVSDLPPEFQLRAMLEWVRSGGHLVISVAQQGQEFVKAGSAIADAVPIEFGGVREIEAQLLDESEVPGSRVLAKNGARMIQATGRLRPGARAVSGMNLKGLEQHPLAVTGMYGQGAITMVTIDAGHPELERAMGDANWMEFWNAVAGWTGLQATQIRSRVDVEQGQRAGREVYSMPQEFRLGTDLVNSIDVTEQTQVRVLVTILFLGAYWLLAGPIGHLVMRYYKVVHWSWWIFGATVLVATSVAGLVVLVLQVTTYDLRHRTFVMGTVGSPEVSVVGFYGIYAPASGPVEIEQPVVAGNGPAAGVNYLAPLCTGEQQEIKSFADPQSYNLNLESPNSVSPVFRNTLKKLQGRWTGMRPGLMGNAAFTLDAAHPLTGELVNNTGYFLEDVLVVTYRPQANRGMQATLYTLPAWKAGDRVKLETDLQAKEWYLRGMERSAEKYLQLAGWRLGRGGFGGGHPFGGNFDGLPPEEKRVSDAIDADLAENLLFTLLDLRKPDLLLNSATNIHHEAVRGIGRWLDRTKALRASGVLIIARAGRMEERDHRVPAPVAIKVNGREVAGQGEVLFAWALPVAGTPPAGAMPLLRDPEEDAGVDVEAVPGVGGRGAGRGARGR